MKKDNYSKTGGLIVKEFFRKELLTTVAFPLVAFMLFFSLLVIFVFPRTVKADDLPYYLMDRGKGLPTSLFGTYIEKGQLLVYPFYEYIYNSSEEYKPSDFDYSSDQEFEGTSKEHELLLFLSYGVTDWLSVELEGALYTWKKLEKDGDDTSNMPDEIDESGLGDVEAQVRWRWNRETEVIPEFFSFFEVAFPFQKNKDLIGTQDWEFALGAGVIKGFRWGTLTARGSILYEEGDGDLGSGEYALEYLKRVSPKWRLFAAVEGEEDEISLIGEVQYFIRNDIFLKLGSGFGITDQTPDFAPEVGVMFVF
jgi:hypothetical protein